MNRATGINASITLPTGHYACWDRFSLTKGQRITNVTCFVDTNEVNQGGLGYGSWSAEGTTKYNDTNTSPGFDSISNTPGSATFTFASSCSVTTDVLVSEITGSADINADNRISARGVTSGSPTETWDETSN